MNSKDKGDITEAVIIAEFMKNGIVVLEPRGDNQRYDLVIELNDRFLRVQCKTGILKNGTVIANLRSNKRGTIDSGIKYINKSYTENEIDLFAIFCPQLNQSFLFPVGTNSGTVTFRVTESRQKNGIRNSEDYEFSKQLEKIK